MRASEVGPRVPAAVAVGLCILAGAVASAQRVVTGHVSLLLDYLPHVEGVTPGSSFPDLGALELRARLFAERKLDVGRHVRIDLSGFVEGLIAHRPNGLRDRDTGSLRSDRTAILRPQDLFIEVAYDRVELRAGFSRVVWGRLDELQPSDVVNPLDISRFVFEGRSEARLPVGLVRGRLFLPGGAQLEAVVVPVFRSGRFDQLDEISSPFNLAAPAPVCLANALECVVPIVDRHEPPAALRNTQGGARLSVTSGRVDWGVAVYRGFEALPVLTPSQFQDRPGAAFPPRPRIDATFPRFTMIGGDVETVTGAWGLRGEVAAFLEDTFQSLATLDAVPGRSVEAGFGIDRKAGSYRVSGNVVVRHRAVGRTPQADRGRLRTTPTALPASATDVTLVGAAERSFARDTRVLKWLGVHNVTEGAAFLRTIAAISLRDNVWLEGSAGWFIGDRARRVTAGPVLQPDAIGLFGDRDFVYGRLKVYF